MLTLQIVSTLYKKKGYQNKHTQCFPKVCVSALVYLLSKYTDQGLSK